jgi:hypothetical protein
MSSVCHTVIVPDPEMPLIQIDSLVLTSLIEKTKKITEELEFVLQQQTNSSIQSKPIIVRKPIDLLNKIEKDESLDPYDQLLQLADAISIYNSEKIGNDFKHLFEKIFIKACLKLRSIGEVEGCIGLNTVFLSTIVKVRDIKWLLQLIAIFHGYNQLFQLSKEHVETYSKIGSRDCQILINKIGNLSSALDETYMYTILINTLINEKNLEECKKLVSQGVSIYRTRDLEYCLHSNSLEKCYHHYSNPDRYSTRCFENKLNHELSIIKYSVIDHLSNDIDKALEIINWIVYEYPSRIGYKIKVEDEGIQYLDNQIKEYCERKDKMHFYKSFKENQNEFKPIIISAGNFYKIRSEEKEEYLLCITHKKMLFVMFYDSTEVNNFNTILSDFMRLPTITSISKSKFGLCDLSLNKSLQIFSMDSTTKLKDLPAFILFIDEKPVMRYEGKQTLEGFVEFMNNACVNFIK